MFGLMTRKGHLQTSVCPIFWVPIGFSPPTSCTSFKGGGIPIGLQEAMVRPRCMYGFRPPSPWTADPISNMRALTHLTLGPQHYHIAHLPGLEATAP